VLRRLRPADLHRFHAYRSDSGLAIYQGWSAMTLFEAKEFIDAMADVAALRGGKWIQIATAESPSGALVGDVGLLLEADGLAAELGFTLCRDVYGRGTAARAPRAAVNLVYAVSSAQTVRVVTDVRNLSSIRALERASFSRSHARNTAFRSEPCTDLVYVHRRTGT